MRRPLRPEPLILLWRRVKVQALEQVRVAAGAGQPRGIPIGDRGGASVSHLPAGLRRSIYCRMPICVLRGWDVLELQVRHHRRAGLMLNSLLRLADLLPDLLVGILNLRQMAHVLHLGRSEMLRCVDAGDARVAAIATGGLKHDFLRWFEHALRLPLLCGRLLILVEVISLLLLLVEQPLLLLLVIIILIHLNSH